ncbi:hypothetical protein ABWH96_10915 [Marivirga tractuosa]|uniref:hypothetical protein n=1 Tax=Marivirga tractuosa TaxID=1006 RepID=UPI0035D0617E
MSKLKKYTKTSWLGPLLVLVFYLPLVFVFVYNGINQVFFILMTISVVFVFIINKDVFMSSTYIVIKHTYVPFIKFRFPISDVTKIQIIYLGGRGNKEALKITINNRKKKRFYMSLGHDFQEFINDVRANNIEVDTSRHPKLK